LFSFCGGTNLLAAFDGVDGKMPGRTISYGLMGAHDMSLRFRLTDLTAENRRKSNKGNVFVVQFAANSEIIKLFSSPYVRWAHFLPGRVSPVRGLPSAFSLGASCLEGVFRGFRPKTAMDGGSTENEF
jgi:hypothetical protein